MVDMKKQERDELHRAIWAIADELRGSVDEFASRADVDHFARCVPCEEIAQNEYNLSVST